tara:strand:+ start:70 stop:555 length:486 start_codon:yes stop_codon:yes gene_type:complete
MKSDNTTEKSLMYQRDDGTFIQVYIFDFAQEKKVRKRIHEEFPNATIIEQSGHGLPMFEEDAIGAYWDAYEINKKTKKPTVSMKVAREVRLNQLRACREETFKVLDQDVLVALGKGKQSNVDTIEKQKQKLRDLPQRVKSGLSKSKTLSDLDDILPPELYA